jgi:hypothetical protein
MSLSIISTYPEVQIKGAVRLCNNTIYTCDGGVVHDAYTYPSCIYIRSSEAILDPNITHT